MRRNRKTLIEDLLKRTRNDKQQSIIFGEKPDKILSICEIAEALAQHTGRPYGQEYYLAKSFSIREKCLSILRNFSFTVEHTPHDTLDALLDKDITLYELNADTISYRITCCLTRDHHHEGEWSLELTANNEPLFILAFTVIPAAFVGASGDEVMLISRMQGRAGKFPEIRAATRAMGDITPQAALYCAARGLARAMDIPHIAGPCAENLPSFRDQALESFRQNYDGFFLANGAARLANGFYLLNVLLPAKPLDQVEASKRRRSKRKRQRKEQIAAAALQNWRAKADNPDQRNGDQLAQFKDQAFQDCIVKLIERDHLLGERKALLDRLSHHIIVQHDLFDPQWYLATNPDVLAAGVDPVMHFVEHGAQEGRNPSRVFVTQAYQAEYPETGQSPVNPLVHFCLNAAEAKSAAPETAPPVLAEAEAQRPGRSRPSNDLGRKPSRRERPQRDLRFRRLWGLLKSFSMDFMASMTAPGKIGVGDAVEAGRRGRDRSR